MARVFISYRRADGQYAVGWIEERLARLDEVTSVRTAFRDNTTLRLGDDLPDVLAAEVEDCDVLIAVIGPHWRGDRPDGTARILDPNDWIAREIELALKFDKRIVPVLIGGIEPLDADTIPSELRPLTALLALRFQDVEDLDRLDEEVREYLDGLDRERARVHGLAEPITVPPFRQPWWVWLAALAAGVAGTLVGYATSAHLTVGGITIGGAVGATESWRRLSAFDVGVWAFFAVVGVSYFHRALAGVIEVQWRTVGRTGLLALTLILLTVKAFAPGGDERVVANVLQATLAVVLLSPWIVMLLGVTWSTTISEGIRGRTSVLAIHHRNLMRATSVLVSALSLSVVTTATLVYADANGNGWSFGDSFSMMSFGALLTLIVLAALVHSSRELCHQSELVRAEIADLAPVYRRTVESVLPVRPVDTRSPLFWTAMVPTLVASGCVLVGVAKTSW